MRLLTDNIPLRENHEVIGADSSVKQTGVLRSFHLNHHPKTFCRKAFHVKVQLFDQPYSKSFFSSSKTKNVAC